nr:unnamed protein product [Digitaria exilis]
MDMVSSAELRPPRWMRRPVPFLSVPPVVVVVVWWWGRPRPRVVWLTGYGVRRGCPTTNLARGVSGFHSGAQVPGSESVRPWRLRRASAVSTRPRTPRMLWRDETRRDGPAGGRGRGRLTTTATALLDGSGQLRDAEIAFEIRVF